MPKKRLLLVITLGLWIALLVHLSSQPYSEQTLIPWMKQHVNQKELATVLPAMTLEYGNLRVNSKWMPFAFLEIVFRKTAHLFVYFILGMLVCYTLRSCRLPVTTVMAMSILAVGIAAGADEWNQRSRMFRTGQLQDVGLDLIGGVAGIVLTVSLTSGHSIGNKKKPIGQRK
jgi:VanZ family protein